MRFKTPAPLFNVNGEHGARARCLFINRSKIHRSSIKQYYPERLLSVVALPPRTQSLKAAIVFDRDVTVKASSKNALNLQNSIKTVTFLVTTLFFSRTMCLGFTITASWSKMPLMTRKLSFTSEVKFVYLLFLRNFYLVNHLNNTKSQQMLFTS
jgi:hypothetical protein